MDILCKMVGALWILGAVSYFAHSYNQTLELRNIELRKLYSILLQLKSEIGYMCNTLPECFGKLADNEKEPFKSWLKHLVSQMEESEELIFCDIWKENLTFLHKSSALEKSDVEPLYELSDKLGCVDTKAQLKAIDYALLHIERNRTALEGEMNQKKKVVVTLSLFCGFMTLILLI